jgi:hypothetical protein
MWVPTMDGWRRTTPIILKTLDVDEFDHSASWPSKVRNVSRLGSQSSTLELTAISLDSLERLGRFAWRLCLFSSTPRWTRTANGFVRPTSIPQTNRWSSALRINFRMADETPLVGDAAFLWLARDTPFGRNCYIFAEGEFLQQRAQ